MQTNRSIGPSKTVIEDHFADKNLSRKISNYFTKTVQSIATTLIIALGIILMGCALYTIVKTSSSLIKFAVKSNPFSQKGISNSKFLLDCLGDLILNTPLFLVGRKIFRFGAES
ncbi:MAG: hypothetical protein EB053_00780 [Chlamydiae bacterium]|nr:hypothetical protein [Chlamydiota bacterium]